MFVVRVLALDWPVCNYLFNFCRFSRPSRIIGKTSCDFEHRQELSGLQGRFAWKRPVQDMKLVLTALFFIDFVIFIRIIWKMLESLIIYFFKKWQAKQKSYCVPIATNYNFSSHPSLKWQLKMWKYTLFPSIDKKCAFSGNKDFSLVSGGFILMRTNI